MSIEISDSAVEAATQAYFYSKGYQRDSMRAAIAAALPLIVGEPVGWQILLTKGRYGWEECTQECYEETLRTGRYLGLDSGTKDVEVRPLYAIKQGASRE